MIEVIEKEALKLAADWAKEKKILKGKYPSMEEFFKKKHQFFATICKQLKEEINQLQKGSRTLK